MRMKNEELRMKNGSWFLEDIDYQALSTRYQVLSTWNQMDVLVCNSNKGGGDIGPAPGVDISY